MSTHGTNFHFEQIPVATVREIAKLDEPEQEEIAIAAALTKDAACRRPSRVKESEKMISTTLEPDDIRYPLWQRPLLTALMETSKEKAEARIAEAKVAIYGRLQVITQSADHHAEHQALRDGLTMLRILENESEKAS